MYRLGWFTTGRGEGSRSLLTAMQTAITSGEVAAKIAFIFLSREPGEAEGSDQFIKLAQSYDIPLVCKSYRRYRDIHGGNDNTLDGTLPQWRLDYDREVMAELEPFTVDLSVLAGYMLIVGAEMCRRYDLLNLHPAAPDGPKGTWQEVIHELINAKAAQSGIMMHLATPELDRGPVVSYCRYPIQNDDFTDLWGGHQLCNSVESSLFKAIRRAGMVRELPLVVASVKAFTEGRVRITADKQVVDSDGKLIAGYDLTAEIEAKVAEL
jgi:phosphoribosylglycinamide formyltransferase 1